VRLNIIDYKYFGKMKQKGAVELCGRIYGRSNIIDFTRLAKVVGEDLMLQRIELMF